MCVCLFLDDPILKVMPKFLLISLLTTNPSRTMDVNTQDQESDYPGEGEELETHGDLWLPQDRPSQTSQMLLPSVPLKAGNFSQGERLHLILGSMEEYSMVPNLALRSY